MGNFPNIGRTLKIFSCDQERTLVIERNWNEVGSRSPESVPFERQGSRYGVFNME